MRISIDWLRELVGIELAVEELAERLTLAGFEVEDIEDRRTWADGVVIGEVIEREQHPNADRLSVCKVNVGAAEPLQIVCGASNVRAGIYVAVATLGTYLPCIDLKMKSTKLRGVKSEGMICSLAELGLEKEADGIHIFGEVGSSDFTPGTDVRPLLGLTDVILDLSSTANRADALSMVGIAREVKALTGASLTLPETTVTSYADSAPAIALQAEEGCNYYIGTVIRGVKVGPSPDWLRQRLVAAGVRPINNVVDVTNYVLLEYGQPLHAFDLERLQALAGADFGLGVRAANDGEALTTLDGQERTLSEVAMVITAGDQAIALAGVMGGEATEVHDSTTDLLLEAAWFDPIRVRRSARSQGLRSEASTRYERGVNAAELAIAAQRAIDLILQVAGGEVCGQRIADERRDAHLERSITLRLERLNELLGPVEKGEELADIEAEDVERILTALGCSLTLTDDATWQVRIPPYRSRDLEREIDLIEEVARLYGYDNFADTLPAKSELGCLSAEEELRREVREVFRGAGLTELMHYSLVKPGESGQVQLANPLLAEYAALRTNLLDGLIEAYRFNREQGNGALNGFEIGRIFWRGEEDYEEMDRLAGVIGGDPSVGRWQRGGKEQPLDWYAAKGLLESCFQRLGVTVEYQPSQQDPRLHPGRTASLWLQGEELGRFGQIHPELARHEDLPAEVYLFDLDLDLLMLALDRDSRRIPLFKPFSSFPASERDIAFYANLETPVTDLEKAMRKAAGPLLQSVELFDEYRGEHVPEGQRSLAFRLRYRSAERTLTDEDIDPAQQKVRDILSEKYAVSLRS